MEPEAEAKVGEGAQVKEEEALKVGSEDEEEGEQQEEEEEEKGKRGRRQRRRRGGAAGDSAVAMVKRELLERCLTCPLCRRLLREATTISECLHTCEPFLLCLACSTDPGWLERLHLYDGSVRFSERLDSTGASSWGAAPDLVARVPWTWVSAVGVGLGCFR